MLCFSPAAERIGLRAVNECQKLCKRSRATKTCGSGSPWTPPCRETVHDDALGVVVPTRHLPSSKRQWKGGYYKLPWSSDATGVAARDVASALWLVVAEPRSPRPLALLPLRSISGPVGIEGRRPGTRGSAEKTGWSLDEHLQQRLTWIAAFSPRHRTRSAHGLGQSPIIPGTSANRWICTIPDPDRDLLPDLP